MKYSLLVALREFGENVKTKGFWIGILLFPILIAAGFQVPRLLEKYAKPTRTSVSSTRAANSRRWWTPPSRPTSTSSAASR